ncbi:MAG: CehA/McbA family metallohydrolase [Pseudomonadota bacterium]|nr:CehA/McbA family metallohydrolase [Pseudomonadota bacterium]
MSPSVRSARTFGALLLLSAGLPALPGCAPEGCLSGAEDCVIPSPCEALTFTCEGGSTEVYVIGAGDTLPTQPSTLASPGDIVLGNDKVVVVIEALDHPHYLGPTGGGLVDFTTRDLAGASAANDSLRHVYPTTGVLPGDAANFTSVELFDEGDIKAVQLLGTLDGYPDVRVATRYEVRPCEPGVRIRTEIVNETVDSLSWFPTDAWYFGDRGNLPFVPGPGLGFTYPPFGLTTLLDGFRDVPYMVSGTQGSPQSGAAVYAEVACSEESLSGFHSVQISAIGQTPRIVQPRDYTVFERFIAAVNGQSVASAGDIALDLREQLFGEPYTELSGTLIAPGGSIGEGLRASVLVSEGNAGMAVEDRTPWSHTYPDADGRWSVRVPTGRDYVVTAEAFGQGAGEVEVSVGDSPAEAPTLTLAGAGEVTIDATIDGVADHVLVFVVPSDDTTDIATTGEMFGHFGQCAPLLGNPHGPSPACNRVLVNGPTTLPIPPGTYDFVAVAGPFSSMGAALGVRVDAGTGQSVLLEIEMLDLQPAGTLSGDFHIHGGASFDSGIPDADRVKAFLASRIQVVATTEHDTVWDYSGAAEALGAADRIQLISGTESTGHILFPFRSDYGFPLVVGHWNFWPVAFDPAGPYRGASWDELAEPGALMQRQRDEGNWDPDIGVAQLNHPVGGLQFGRNYGWISATGMNMNEPPQESYDGTGQSLFLHTPDGADFSNADFDVQEVMNGTQNDQLLAYRSFWFYLLNHGIVRAGTANSDSHTLTENVVGSPRSVVWTDTTFDTFDLGAFDASLREGRAIGTNGPVLLARVTDAGATYMPSVLTFAATPAAQLDIVVTAAPWVPVEEVRIVVNGEVVRTLSSELLAAVDPFGTDITTRLDVSIPLADLLPASGDAWIVIEAGAPLEENLDLDCDGLPDTGDNNGDGAIDGADVDTNGDLLFDGLDVPPEIDADGCLAASGPLTNPLTPERGTPAWYFRAVTPPTGYPMSFTNPFLVDRDADGTFTGVDQ